MKYPNIARPTAVQNLSDLQFIFSMKHNLKDFQHCVCSLTETAKYEQKTRNSLHFGLINPVSLYHLDVTKDSVQTNVNQTKIQKVQKLLVGN